MLTVAISAIPIRRATRDDNLGLLFDNHSPLKPVLHNCAQRRAPRGRHDHPVAPVWITAVIIVLQHGNAKAIPLALGELDDAQSGGTFDALAALQRDTESRGWNILSDVGLRKPDRLPRTAKVARLCVDPHPKVARADTRVQRIPLVRRLVTQQSHVKGLVGSVVFLRRNEHVIGHLVRLGSAAAHDLAVCISQLANGDFELLRRRIHRRYAKSLRMDELARHTGRKRAIRKVKSVAEISSVGSRARGRRQHDIVCCRSVCIELIDGDVGGRHALF